MAFYYGILDESISRKSISVAKRARNLLYSQARIFLNDAHKDRAGLALMAASAQTTLIVDWQYCLAPSHAEHKTAMSATFRRGPAVSPRASG
jgi:hypothetical protein